MRKSEGGKKTDETHKPVFALLLNYILFRGMRPGVCKDGNTQWQPSTLHIITDIRPKWKRNMNRRYRTSILGKDAVACFCLGSVWALDNITTSGRWSHSPCRHTFCTCFSINAMFKVQNRGYGAPFSKFQLQSFNVNVRKRRTSKRLLCISFFQISQGY